MPKRSPHIRFSSKHGVNPSLGVCFVCGEDDGTIVLTGRLKGDAKAPHRAIWSREPCPACRAFMQQGVIFISVRDGESGGEPDGQGREGAAADGDPEGQRVAAGRVVERARRPGPGRPARDGRQHQRAEDGPARGAAYPAVVAGDFQRAELRVPSRSLLASFDEFVEPTLTQVHNLRIQNQKLRAARDPLLPRLMSGEVPV